MEITQTTTTTSMPDLRALFARATTTAAAVTAAIGPTQHDAPTGLDFTVAQLAEHVVMAARRTMCAGRGIPFEEWPIDASDVAAGAWSAALDAVSTDIADAWDGVPADRPLTLPWGTFPADNVIGIYMNELTVHSWDIARATGQDPAWDDDVVAEASIAIHAQIPDADRGPMWEALAAEMPEGMPLEVPFANAVDVAAGVDARHEGLPARQRL